MPRLIIAIIDMTAQDVVGPVQLIKHPAQGIRFFSDVATQPDTIVAKHVEEYHLLQLGILEDDLTIRPEHATLITGQQWLAAQQANANRETNK